MQVVAKIPRRSRIILVAFAAAVSVFRLAEPPEMVAADMFPGHAVPAPEVHIIFKHPPPFSPAFLVEHSQKVGSSMLMWHFAR